MKREIVKQFDKEIDFFPSGTFVIIYSTSINPCKYSIAVLKGKGLRDSDFIKFFSTYIRNKIKNMIFEPLPESPEEMLASFNNGPLTDLYNVIYATM